MQRSRVLVPVHFVWAIRGRFEWITEEWEPRVQASIRAQAEKMGAEVLAVGGMPDHVHLAVLFSSTVSISQFVQRIKGTTSRLIHKELAVESPFYWQEGYGAFGFHKSMAPRVIAYIKDQKQHHENGTTLAALETTTIEV